jgi:hypothetical protein
MFEADPPTLAFDDLKGIVDLRSSHGGLSGEDCLALIRNWPVAPTSHKPGDVLFVDDKGETHTLQLEDIKSLAEAATVSPAAVKDALPEPGPTPEAVPETPVEPTEGEAD